MIAVTLRRSSSTTGRYHTRRRTNRNDRRSVRDSNRRHAAHLPRRKDYAMEAARLLKSKQPHSMVEVKDLKVAM